jgi:hypothetical protein
MRPSRPWFAKMHEAELSAKTITNYAGLVRLVVASAPDRNGDQLFHENGITSREVSVVLRFLGNKVTPIVVEQPGNRLGRSAPGHEGFRKYRFYSIHDSPKAVDSD